MCGRTHTKKIPCIFLSSSIHSLTRRLTHMQTPKQIKAYPPTVAVAPQDDEGLDPSTSLYLQINGWPPNQLQPDWPHQLKARPKALLQTACWILYQSNDSPQKPRLCQLVFFFPLSFSLGLCHLSLFFFFFFNVNASNSFCLCSACVYERKGTCSRNESKMHERVIFLEEQKVNFNIL